MFRGNSAVTKHVSDEINSERSEYKIEQEEQKLNACRMSMDSDGVHL